MPIKHLEPLLLLVCLKESDETAVPVSVKRFQDVLTYARTIQSRGVHWKLGISVHMECNIDVTCVVVDTWFCTRPPSVRMCCLLLLFLIAPLFGFSDGYGAAAVSTDAHIQLFQVLTTGRDFLVSKTLHSDDGSKWPKLFCQNCTFTTLSVWNRAAQNAECNNTTRVWLTQKVITFVGVLTLLNVPLAPLWTDRMGVGAVRSADPRVNQIWTLFKTIVLYFWAQECI